MTTATIPTNTPVPFSILHDNSLPAGVFRSYVRLLAAAQGNLYTHTEPLDFKKALAPLLGLSPSRAHRHLSLLSEAGLLDWTTGGDHCYVIRFLRGPARPPGQAPREESGDRQFPNPGQAGRLLKTVSAEQGSGNPDLEKSSSGFSLSGSPDSPHQDSDDVVVFNLNIKKESPNLHQQHTGSRAGEPPANEIPDAYEQRVFHCLGRAGVWARAAREVAVQMAANRERAYNAYLPDLGDVLGWLAFAFADGRANGVRNPAALVAANLRGDRRCPASYRPPQVCQACQRDETHCECEQPRLDYPPKFLEFAFKADFEPELETFWGVCLACHAFPCRCEADN